MSSLYHPLVYDRDIPVGSYWEASAPPLGRETPPLEGAVDCEVAVIGAGYTGLTAALSLVEEHGADVTVLDLDRRQRVDPARFQSKGRNTPFGGWSLLGAPVMTIVGGQVAWRAEKG